MALDLATEARARAAGRPAVAGCAVLYLWLQDAEWIGMTAVAAVEWVREFGVAGYAREVEMFGVAEVVEVAVKAA